MLPRYLTLGRPEPSISMKKLPMEPGTMRTCTGLPVLVTVVAVGARDDPHLAVRQHEDRALAVAVEPRDERGVERRVVDLRARLQDHPHALDDARRGRLGLAALLLDLLAHLLGDLGGHDLGRLLGRLGRGARLLPAHEGVQPRELVGRELAEPGGLEVLRREALRERIVGPGGSCAEEG